MFPIVFPHVCVGWCVRLPDVLSLIVSPHVCLCWMACPPSQGFVSPSHPVCPIERIVSHCLALSPHRFACVGWWVRLPDVLSSLFVSHCLPTCVPVMVCLPSLASPLSAIVSHCLPTCVPVLDGASAFPRVLSPLVSLCSLGCVRLPGGLVSPCVLLSPLVSPCVPLCHLLSPCLPSCFPLLDGVCFLKVLSPLFFP